MAYAENTAVPVERSRAEIEKMLEKYGADSFANARDAQRAVVGFRASGRFVRFVLPLPNPEDDRFRASRRSRTISRELYEREVRRLWRALALVIKAKLEAVESGIETFEQAFMAHILMPDGKTVTEHAVPMIEEAYRTGKTVALLPAGNL